MGPGRWGTSNPDLGVHVDYADIFNSKALVELSGEGIGPAPEPSLGTHFFQDLLEGQIFPWRLISAKTISIGISSMTRPTAWPNGLRWNPPYLTACA